MEISNMACQLSIVSSPLFPIGGIGGGGYLYILLELALFMRLRGLLIQRHSRHRNKQHAGNQFGSVIIPVFDDQGQVLV